LVKHAALVTAEGTQTDYPVSLAGAVRLSSSRLDPASSSIHDLERVLGPDHPDTLSFRNDLAGAYRSAGDLGQAIPLYEQTLQDAVRVLGPRPPKHADQPEQPGLRL
jgi:hypothetical protein